MARQAVVALVVVVVACLQQPLAVGSASWMPGDHAPPPDYDAVIERTHAAAAVVREARLAAFDLTDFDRAANGHRPIPANMTPESQVWTGKGYQLVAAALGVQFRGKNATAMQKAADLVRNMTINFRYNGYKPTSESGCVDKALQVYCNGTTACGSALAALCNATRPAAPQHHAHPACLQCVGTHVGDPSLASCSDADVSKFCSSPSSTQTESECTACANGLQKIEMTCESPSAVPAPVRALTEMRDARVQVISFTTR
jgi:hypothetical protein